MLAYYSKKHIVMQYKASSNLRNAILRMLIIPHNLRTALYARLNAPKREKVELAGGGWRDAG